MADNRGEALGHPVTDADQHYYEALDAFTRHLDPADAERCVTWCEIDGRQYHVVAGRVSRAVTNPTFNPVAKAGALHDYFRGNAERKFPMEYLTEREPIPEAYRHAAARVEALDEQGLASCLLFPTLGVLYEELLKDDPEAVCLTFSAFNRWLVEDWGFAHEERVFAAPYIALADVDWAISELDWAVENGARMVVMRPAAPTTVEGRLSPFDTKFDPFWRRLEEVGIPVVLHAADGGVSFNGYAAQGFSARFRSSGGREQRGPSIAMFAIEQAIYDWLVSAMLENLFTRFPNLRVASIENGAEFVPDLFRKLKSTAKKIPGWWTDDDPVGILREHLWVSPFWEDDLVRTCDLLGADRVLFGSDWPHIEGMPTPLDYLGETDPLSSADRRRVLHDNAQELLTPRPS
jgi:predicted TIM-barrel fold metal-dependent hydrolase